MADTPRDPKLIEAEQRLLALGREAEAGLPIWLKSFFLLVIGGPLLIFFVPDVGVRLRGAKLRYNFKSHSHFKQQGVAQITLSAPSIGKVPTIIDQVSMQLDSRFDVEDSDTGGNCTYRRNIEKFVYNTPLGFPNTREKPPADLAGWVETSMMNPRGIHIPSLMPSTGQSGRPLQRFNQRTEQEAAAFVAFSPDIYEVFFNSLSTEDLAPINRSHYFEYPANRVGVGDSWENNLSVMFRTKWMGVMIAEPIRYTVKGFERTAGGFMVTIEWDSKVTAKPFSTTNTLWFLLENSVVSGTYSGRARINYANGVIQEWDGQYSLLITPPLSSTQPLVMMMGMWGSPGSESLVLPLQLDVTEKIRRI